MPLSSTTLMLRHNLHQLAIALDQLGNVFVSCLFREKAWADETLSAHAWRWQIDGAREWPRRVIDTILFWQDEHCRKAYENEKSRTQLPEAER
nr:MAG TPA: hypothetical protein [Caudoviricetes sp.]